MNQQGKVPKYIQTQLNDKTVYQLYYLSTGNFELFILEAEAYNQIFNEWYASRVSS